MKLGVSIVLTCVLFGLTACGSLMHPRAEEFYQQAKGQTAVETGLNLVGMLETTIQKAMNQSGTQVNLDDLHDQLHALHKVFCHMTEAQTQRTAYVHAVTLGKELRTLFHRLWEFREDPPLRNLHLGLLAARLQEFKLALQAVKR